MRSKESETPGRTRRARREDLIAAAIQAISQDGHRAASLERIAREAGTSKGNALYRFSSNDVLLSPHASSDGRRALHQGDRRALLARRPAHPTPGR
ncbi:TetR family transcriptional regulator [Nonomuraea roseoviolacea]|uniref:TetR family transcriptional regulator n=1 Tax=Nonomuraea roseoviolacea TaxID=103837 RepID=UPI003B5C9B76